MFRYDELDRRLKGGQGRSARDLCVEMDRINRRLKGGQGRRTRNVALVVLTCLAALALLLLAVIVYVL